jgi:replicative DNA helicase
VPPHDLDAEAAVLSAVMLDRDALDRVLVMLKPEHFYSEANARIYQAAHALAVAMTPIDIVNVASWLRDREWLAKCGGTEYIARLADATPAVGHVESHAKTVFEKWRVRQTIATCQRVAAEGYGDVVEVQGYVNAAAESLDALVHANVERRAVVGLGLVLRDAFTTITAAADRGVRITGTPTGYDRFDAKTAGLHEGDLVIIAARPGMGKALTEDSKVLTPTGWRRMGSLRVGDAVIGADGKPRGVVGVFDQGEKDVFRVTMDDGGSVECCDEHLWLTRTRSDRRRGQPGSVRSTADIRASLHRAGGGLNHSLPFMRAAELHELGPLPLHPYLLGLYLGDGTSRGSSPGIDNPEADIRARAIALLPSGDTMNVGDDGLHLRIRREKRSNEGSTTAILLRALGLKGLYSWQRFIPEIYLRASITDRIALLQGLCDTDGHVVDSGTMVEYSTTSPQMVAGIRYLVGTLGGRTTVTEAMGHYVNEAGMRVPTRTAYRVWISFPASDIVPVSSVKHLARWKSGSRRITERFIKNIDPVGRKRCLCIAVDSPDHLYVTDDFIVTHNTSFVLNVATNVASPRETKHRGQDVVAPGDGVMVFSLEMPREQLAVKMACSEAKVDLGRVRNNSLHSRDWNQLTEASQYLSALPIWIDDTAGLTLTELRTKVRRQQALYDREETDEQPRRRVGLIVVDYLQLMKGREDAQSREQEISELSRGLKALAKELKVPVIALSQLNRSVETRTTKDKRPQLSDLRESGAIEQDADTIIFIYRDDYYNPETSDLKGIAELIIAKQRNGPTGKVFVKFAASYTRFDNLEPGNYPAEEAA